MFSAGNRWGLDLEVPVGTWIAAGTGFGCFGDICHFSGCHVVELKRIRIQVIQKTVCVRHGISKQGIGIGFDTTMRVQFDEDPVGSTGNMDMLIDPDRCPLGGGTIGAADICVFNAGNKTPFTVSEVNGKWTLDT